MGLAANCSPEQALLVTSINGILNAKLKWIGGQMKLGVHIGIEIKIIATKASQDKLANVIENVLPHSQFVFCEFGDHVCQNIVENTAYCVQVLQHVAVLWLE